MYRRFLFQYQKEKVKYGPEYAQKMFQSLFMLNF